MPAPNRRAAMADKLLRRTQESINKADDSGRFSNIFKPEIQIPQWVCGDGQHVIDILPYIVGNHYPTRTFPDVRPGDPSYVLDVWVHKGIGINEDSFVCPARNYGLPCPICEHTAELRRSIDPDADENDPEFGETIKLIKAISPKRRTVYNILCWDSDREINKGVQVWEVAHFFMEKNLTAISQRPARPGGPAVGGLINFPDPWDGKSIVFRREGTGKTTSYIGHSFEDRPEYIPDEYNALIEGNENATYCLDEIVVIPTYETLYEAYFGKPYTGELTVAERVQDEEPALPPTRPRTRPTAAQTPPAAPTTRGRAQSAPTRAAAAPTPASRTRARPAPPPEPEEPAYEEQVCPAGGTFGADVDTFEQCSTCEIWDDCAQANVNLSEMAENEVEQGVAEPEPEPSPPPTRRPAPASRQAASQPAQRTRGASPPPTPPAASRAETPGRRPAPTPNPPPPRGRQPATSTRPRRT